MNLKEIRIGIDNGHDIEKDKGGQAPSGLREGNINFRVANLVVKSLRALGFPVCQSNPLGNHMPLIERHKAFKHFAPHIVVSIHQNDAVNENAKGVETLYRDEPGKILAQCIQKQLLRHGGVDRGVKLREDLSMLKVKGAVCALSEGVFLTKADAHRIDTTLEEVQQAKAIVDGIIAALPELVKAGYLK